MPKTAVFGVFYTAEGARIGEGLKTVIRTTCPCVESGMLFHNRCCVFVGVDVHGDPPCAYTIP